MAAMEGRLPSQGRHRQRQRLTHATGKRNNTPGDIPSGGWSGSRHRRSEGGRLIEPSCELEVLKCIMLRESYLERVTRLSDDMARRAKRSRGQLRDLPPGMVDLLDLLRVATLDVVEAISLWRLSQATPTAAAFEWNGHNYLIKVLHDCDFLDHVEPLRRWLGFETSCNPFFVPFSSQADRNDGSTNLEGCQPPPEARLDKTGLADVGRPTSLGPFEVPSVMEHGSDGGNKGWTRNRNERKAQSNPNPSPYAAAVVNDPRLLPSTKVLPLSRGGGLTSAKSAASKAGGSGSIPTGVMVNVERLVPNIVSREDMRRVDVARQVLVEEERRVVVAIETTAAGLVAATEEESRSLTTRFSGSPTLRKGSRNMLPPAADDPRKKENKSRGGLTLASIQNTRENATLHVTPSLSAGGAPNTPVSVSSNGNIGFLTQSAAGLIQQPPPEPHPGLGPVLLQSDLPGGECCPNPFVHTVKNSSIHDRVSKSSVDDRMTNSSIDIRVPNTVDFATSASDGALNTARGRCSTAPEVPSSGSDNFASSPEKNNVSSHSPPDCEQTDCNRRAATAPSTISVKHVFPPSTPTAGEAFGSVQLHQLSGNSKNNARLSAIRARRNLSRKAGAELRALTAAGTTGRRQPPPREARLRRLARDVERHSAELRKLAREEERLGNILACENGRSRGKQLLPRVKVEDKHAMITNADVQSTVPRFDREMTDFPAPGKVLGGKLGSKDLGEPSHTNDVRTQGSEKADQDYSGSIDQGVETFTTEVIIGKQQSQKESVDFTSVTPIGPRVDVVEALLKEKRQEIALKSFHLGVKRDELRCLLMVQKHERKRKRGLELERMRTRLQEGQSLPQDETTAETLEDGSCLLVQKRFRGNVGRKYAAWYKRHIHQGATTIQRGVRYIWDRRATARRLRLEALVTLIQAAIRMYVARKRYMRRLLENERASASFKVQTVCRGMKGRKRAAARRAMKHAAGKALEWVSLERLQPRHLKELARAIHGALVDPVRQFPPAGVLGAIRAALTILEDAADTEDGAENGSENHSENVSGRKMDTVTFQTALGRTLRGAVCAPDLTWEMAARVLGRPFRLLRRMRAFASGLGASSDQTPVRLLHLSPKAVELLRAYRHDPSWSEEALLAIGEGGTAAASLVGWATELERVYREQPRLRDFLRDAQPAWLRKSRALQKRRRASELRAESCRFAVAVARQHQQMLEARGKAYGDPLAALEVLEVQCQAAEADVGVLEARRKGLRAVQEKAEEAEGLKLRQGMEFAEREAAVAARAEEMARRLGNCDAEKLASLATKVIEWEVIARELSRQFSVWKRRCREENLPLLEEWVPPTKGQTVMAQTLGAARAWEQITIAQKERLVDEAGGRRFVKGLTGRRMEIWRGVSEGLMSCREDIESGEARLAEDVRSFEQRILSANEDIAAKKVSLALWDNATEATKALEVEEDADAARDERRTAMGAIIPRGLLDNPTQPRTDGRNSSNGPSRRPTLVLLGLDLPAAVRDEIRADIDRDAPDIFGLHISGVDTLPSVAAEVARTRDRGFLDPCRESCPELQLTPQESTRIRENTQRYLATGSETPGDGRGGHGKSPGGSETVHGHGQTGVGDTRTRRLQAALSAGRNASLEVVPGPGLWARGRFLRDLEALLLGLDYNSGGGERTGTVSRRGGVAVVLIEGDHRNRSGGGADTRYGTKFATTTANISRVNNGNAESPPRRDFERAPPLAGVAARRTKNYLEEAAQCLHDLSTTHGDTPSPFVAISFKIRRSPHFASKTPTGKEHGQLVSRALPAHSADPSDGNERAENEGMKSPKDKCSLPGLELLLAACHMITHPGRQYDLPESHVVHNDTRVKRPAQNPSKPTSNERPAFDNMDEGKASFTVASCLAEECRTNFAKMRSARDVANILREVDLAAVPFDTAASLRLLLQHPAWPTTSPRSNAGGCFASEAFCGWIVAAVAAATEIALTWGGSAHCSDSDYSQNHGCGIHKTVTKLVNAEHYSRVDGNVVELNSTTRSGGSRELLTLEDARSERDRERDLLQELETAMIDEIITIVDDDLALPQLLRRRGGAGNRRGLPPRRECRASEAFTELMETVLRPFQVFTAEHPIHVVRGELAAGEASLPSMTEQQGVRPRDNKFRVSVSRAFGSIYVWARPLDVQREIRRTAVMARLQEEDLIPLVSPNWMETHELSTLRELRSEPAVWRAVVDTLVLHYTGNTRQHPSVENLHVIDPPATSASVPVGEHVGLAAEASTLSEVVSSHDSTIHPPTCSGGVLSFCHPRRLTLESTCLFMGRTVPVKVFEECRGDFWCEAQLPPSPVFVGSASRNVGMRVPKEYIQLLLADDHPMRMQTRLDAFDLRELSTLIADRLKVCRVGSTRRGVRSYRYWLDGAMGEGGDQSKTVDSITAVEAAKGYNQGGGPTAGEFRLSLRKRGVGQVLFSRLVSFWVPGDRQHRLSQEGSDAYSRDDVNHSCGEVGNGYNGENSNTKSGEGDDVCSEEGSDSCLYSGWAHDDGNETRESYGPNVARIVQILVSVKEIAHRGGRGELRGETHDPNLGGRPRHFIVSPELTRLLLEGSDIKTITGEMQGKPNAQYWRDALTWRLRVSADDLLTETAIGASEDRLCDENAVDGTKSPSFSGGEGTNPIKICVDEREPLFSLDLVPARCETPFLDLENGVGELPTAGKTIFDMLLLPPQEASKAPDKNGNTAEIELELVATHRQTMTVFRFSVPAEAFVKEFRGVLLASLSTPTALQAELERPASTALRNVAGTWMQYIPVDRRKGRRATLTFLFPGLSPVTTEPYVGLRGEGYERRDVEKLPHATRVGSAVQWQRRSSTHMREAARAAATISQRERPKNARRSVCESGITTPRVEANQKNERMVLRRSLAVPRLDELEKPQKTHLVRRTHGTVPEEEEMAKLASKKMVLSLFEVFSTGPENRVVRHLKICARDETVRPAVETATTIPWVGTCEGVEGGALWRVVTRCLGFRSIRNDRRTFVGIRLEVLPQRDTEPPERSGNPRPDPDKPETCGLISAEVDAPVTSAGRGEEHAGSFMDNSRQHGPQGISPDSGMSNASPFTPFDTAQASLLQGRSQNNERDKVRRTKIYHGWHRITGVRLHVQCLQEEGCANFEADGMASAGKVDINEKPWRPAGRGGTISLPRASILLFRLSDPRTGRTSEVQLSVEDALRNSSTHGGIVDAGLLDAGRRPALAKSIAQHLQLVFDVSGGYRATLPLPVGWKRTASPKGALASC